MKQKHEIFGWVWWIFLIVTGIASFFSGLIVGKVVRRILVALAVPLLVGQVAELIVLIVSALGASKIIGWLEAKWFLAPLGFKFVPAERKLA